MSRTSRASLKIDGMTCGHCVAAVRRALESVPGVQVADVQIGSAELNATADELPIQAIKDAVADAGYYAEVARE
jgi:copper chaperone